MRILPNFLKNRFSTILTPGKEKTMKKTIIFFCILILFAFEAFAEPKFELLGDWTVKVTEGTLSSTFSISPPERIAIVDEKVDAVPIYNEKGPEYRRGKTLRGVAAQECSVRGAIDLKTVVVRNGIGPGAETFIAGTDYQVDDWGGMGRLEQGRWKEGSTGYVSYSYAKMRLDSVVLAAGSQKLELRRGTSHVSIPEAPALKSGERRLANIWISGAIERLSEDSLFPVMAERYPASRSGGPCIAEKLLPKTRSKLARGEKIHILAWGDSVTEGGYLPSKDQRWQEQFAERLGKAFPQSEIVLTTEAWGGRNTHSYFAEPSGSVHNYKEKVLEVKPDLVVMEFVNDAGLSGERLFKQYDRILNDFKAIGTEWIILTPHYVRPDWMGFKSNKDIDEDPRPYVASVRQFGKERNIAIAEGSRRYGHLWRQGIPYITLMMNNINHPNGYGMSLFADALMELFDKE